jgi:hypothetical protein
MEMKSDHGGAACSHEGGTTQTPLEDPEEQAHFKTVVSAFFNYSIDAMRDIARMERDFSKVPAKHLEMLSADFKKKRIDKIKRAVI